jgi:uncharacterized coiled-coil protein SlyX
MRDLIRNLVDQVTENEKRIDKNKEKMKNLNQLLYQYESLSVDSYSPAMNLYLGKNRP